MKSAIFFRFWLEQKGKARKLKPELERYLDTSRFDQVQPKYDPRSQDQDQGRLKHKQYYCSKCDVYTKTISQMQAHEEGIKHKRMSARVQLFRCNLCHISVPCQDTLDNHIRGKDHIKRVMELEEQRRKNGEMVTEERHCGYRVGPREMEKLNQTEKEELVELRKTVRMLQTILEDERKKLAERRKKLTRCRCCQVSNEKV